MVQLWYHTLDLISDYARNAGRHVCMNRCYIMTIRNIWVVGKGTKSIRVSILYLT